MDVWQCDLVDVEALSKHNDALKCLLTVVDVFSKCILIVSPKSNTGPTLTSAFQSILKNSKYSKPIHRRPVWVRTDKGN